MNDIKHIVVIRADLKMPAGKLGVQMTHATKALMEDWLEGKKPSDIKREWMGGLRKTIALEVNSEEELVEIFQKAKVAGLEAHLVVDAGLTVFKEPTKTCVGIGPAREADVGKLTGHLKLYGRK